MQRCRVPFLRNAAAFRSYGLDPNAVDFDPNAVAGG